MSQLAKVSEGVLSQQGILDAFVDPKGLTAVIASLKDEIGNFEYDLTTTKGRKEVASFSNNIAKLKIKVDDMGKGLTADMKAETAKVDKCRKKFRDEMDELKILARNPLTAMEVCEAQELKLKHEEHVAAELLVEINRDHEMALLMDDKVTREMEHDAWAKNEIEKQAAEKAVVEKQQNDQRIADEARQESEAAARQVKQLLGDEKRLREEDAKKAIADKIVADQQAEIDKKVASEKAENDTAEAIRVALYEENQKKIQHDAKMLAEKKAREADNELKKKVQTQIMDSLVWEAGLSDFKAKATAKALMEGRIKCVKVSL